MKILVSGAAGLIGNALIPSLIAEGHSVSRLVRGAAAPGDVVWDPSAGRLDAGRLEGFDAVVHLAGESIAAARWTAAKKRRIMDSRVGGTTLLAKALASLSRPPRAFLCASAIGYYGNRSDEVLDEKSAAGSLFLSDVCRAWEAACAPAAAKGVRTVNLRFGVILSAKGGALAKMLLPFRLGLGGPIGSGLQWMSWISIDDAAGAIRAALTGEALKGPVNVVAPNPVTNREFTKALGSALKRPTIFPMPAFAARAAFGEMADELLLAGARVRPAKLEASGFAFHHPVLEQALRDLLGPS